jgi:chromosome partitioning protein
MSTSIKKPKVCFTCNVKGGTGKTNVSFQISGFLSALGYKVLCIDADPQHNLTKSYINYTPDNGLMELLNDECSFTDIVIQPYKDNDVLSNIYLLPCNYDLFFFNNDNGNNKPNKLKTIMDAEYDKGNLNYDVILIDTNPAISLINTNVFVYADNIIGVLDTSLDSLEGFKYLETKVIKPIQEKVNPNLKLFGIVINNNSKTNFSMAMLKTVTRLYGDLVFDEIISTSVKNKESRASKQPLVTYCPKHSSYTQFESLTKEFVERLGD